MLFRCSLCPYLTDIKCNLKAHVVRKHSSENSQSGQLVQNEGHNVKNPEILGQLVKETRSFVKNNGQDVKNPEEIDNNAVSEAIESTTLFKCEKCLKILSTKPILKRHMKICKGITTPYECHICHEIFKNSYSKSRHLKKCTPSPELINEVIEEPIKYKKKLIPQSLRKAVWNTYIGREIGETNCPVCKNSIISPFEFHCGHIVAEIKGGKTCLENLRPICKSCNSSMKTFNLETYQKQFFNNHIRE
jgi:5-methylcytosine-specific restriction endonuclease McrA